MSQEMFLTPQIGLYLPREGFSEEGFTFSAIIFLPTVERIVRRAIESIGGKAITPGLECQIDAQVAEPLYRARCMCSHCPVCLTRARIMTVAGPIVGECTSFCFAQPMGVFSCQNRASLHFSQPITSSAGVDGELPRTACGLPIKTNFSEIPASRNLMVFNVLRAELN